MSTAQSSWESPIPPPRGSSDRARIVQEFGAELGPQLADEVESLVREAAASSVKWGTKSLRQVVEEILEEVHRARPELYPDALHEIGRCVGWQWR